MQRTSVRYHRWLGLALLAMIAVEPSLAQLAHLGPAANIARSRTVPPYDAVSVRRNMTGADNGNFNIADAGVFTATNLPL